MSDENGEGFDVALLLFLPERVRQTNDNVASFADSELGCFIEIDFKFPDEIKEKTKLFPFCNEPNVSSQDTYRHQIKTFVYTTVCDLHKY